MFALTLFACFAVAKAYLWPSPQLDALEAARFDQSGHNAGPIASFIQPCDNFFLGGIYLTGRSNAYHDMATYNITDGTGGMDASVRFAVEQEHTENVGDGIPNTVSLLFTVANRYISMADFLVLGPIIAIENWFNLSSCCILSLNWTRSGGPEIAFRGGRIDAAKPNKPGVPQPQQDLQTHISAFARQGFTETEMISLVACGHTFGGVQHKFFPDIVPKLKDPNSTESVAHFDSTFVTFDNNLAMEYIAGTTQEPLVVGFNHTTNSDQRIFGSDGNITMQTFAESLEHYHSTCATVLARMFNTVPDGVQLTDAITPLPVKPNNVQIILDGDMLKLFVWNMTEDVGRKVVLLWDDHIGGTHRARLGFAGISTAAAGSYTAAWYAFNSTAGIPFQALKAKAGITRMSFVVDGITEDQDGVGFAVQDGVVFSNSSCATTQDPYSGRFDVGVRNGVNPARVYLEQETVDNVQRIIIVETNIEPPALASHSTNPYSIWSIDLADADKFVVYTVGFELPDGTKFSTNDDLAKTGFMYDSPSTTSIPFADACWPVTVTNLDSVAAPQVASQKICNEMSRNEAGLLSYCDFLDFSFFTCYGCRDGTNSEDEHT
ncbi:heme peroxidase [Mycena galopus ATCC 62051]|nr:heme peroxidase [Mycena galopus ATCC 62051]